MVVSNTRNFLFLLKIKWKVFELTRYLRVFGFFKQKQEICKQVLSDKKIYRFSLHHFWRYPIFYNKRAGSLFSLSKLCETFIAEEPLRIG